PYMGPTSVATWRDDTMNSNTLRTTAMGTVGALAVAATLLAGAFGPIRTAAAQTEPAPVVQPIAMPLRTITVVGEGKVRVEPDIARVTIGAETLRPSVREATDANNEMIDAVIAALGAAGVAEEDIQTSGFSVFAERFGPEGPLPDDEVNYRVTNNVVVTVRNLEGVGDLLDAAIEAGANNIYGIEFAIDDTTAIESDARAAAVDSANAKAAELAGLAGVAVGEIVSISEIVGVSPMLGVYRQDVAMGMGGGNSPTIQPGQLNMTTQLQITYASASTAGE
ncbi:MAG: SIMPL domain-containing protein, partial [Caldilineaceae bacterium]